MEKLITALRFIVGVVVAGLVAKGMITEGVGSTVENLFILAAGWLALRRPGDKKADAPVAPVAPEDAQ